MIATERRGLADLLDGLTPEQWATPSLCEGWTVRDVAGHLVVPFEVSMPKVMLRVAGSLFDVDKAMDGMARDQGRRPTEELVASLRANAGSRFMPPTLGPEAPLTDILVHGQDIRRPLGIVDDVDGDRARIVLDRLSGGSKGFVPASRVVGLRFEATDLDWSAGTGPVVSGTAPSLLLAMTGRTVALDELDGDGVDVLRSRLA